MQHVKENGLDLVLLDIEMPEVSGFDALKMHQPDSHCVTTDAQACPGSFHCHPQSAGGSAADS